MVGCRVRCLREPYAVALRWRVSRNGLDGLMTHLGADALWPDLQVVVEGLLEGLERTEVTFEQQYTPEPEPSFRIGLDVIPTGRVIGLLRVLWGADRSGPLASVARTLRARRVAHVQLDIGPSGVTAIRAQLRSADQRLPKRW